MKLIKSIVNLFTAFGFICSGSFAAVMVESGFDTFLLSGVIVSLMLVATAKFVEFKAKEN